MTQDSSPHPTYEAGASPTGQLLTLLVDDEPALLAGLSEGLQLLGLDVLTAGSGAVALEVLRANTSVGVLVTDVKMPGISGIELLRQAMDGRDETAALEGITITAHSSVEAVTASMRSGAIDFLAKPFGLAEAAGAITRALQRATTRRRQACLAARQKAALASAEAEAGALAERLVAAVQAGTRQGVANTRRDDSRAAILAHELRTPLVPVLGYAELLTDNEISADIVRAYAQEIKLGALRLLGTIDQLLEFEALFQPGLVMHPARLSVAALLADATTEVAPHARVREVELLVEAGYPQALTGDAALLRRALVEMLRSAIDATSPAGKVTINVHADASHNWLTVTDTRLAPEPGLPDCHLGHTDGTLGLALPTVRRIAELHGGRFTAERTQAGDTEATLCLPGG